MTSPGEPLATTYRKTPGLDGSPVAESTLGSRYDCPALRNTNGAVSCGATCPFTRAWNGPPPEEGRFWAPPPGDPMVPQAARTRQHQPNDARDAIRTPPWRCR